jgi:uncharacterized protein (TIGR00730 family)
VTSVCVFCASSTRIDPRHLQVATDVGTALGQRGWTLVSGGGSVGSMGAVARAARAAGAHTIGVIPRALVAMEIADNDADELVITDDMRTRKATMEDRADAVLTLPGGLGTLEELFESWTSHSLGLHTKPLIVLDPFGTFDALRTFIDGLVEERLVRPEALASVHWAADVDEAFRFLERALQTVPSAVVTPTAEELLEFEP